MTFLKKVNIFILKSPDKKLVQTLLQGGNRLYGSDKDAAGIAKSFSKFALENDWGFSPETLTHSGEGTEEKFPHIRTLRFFMKEKEELDENLINSFAWEHYKRKLNFHPLVSLELLNTKLIREALDLPLLNEVGGQRLAFLRQKRGGRYKDLYRLGVQVEIAELTVEEAKSVLSALLEKHSSWIHVKDWPRVVKTRDAKDWYAAISVLDHGYLMSFFECEVGAWCQCWLTISTDLPGIAQMKLMDAFRDQDKAVLNGFYALFLGVERDESLGEMDFSILLRALGKKYVAHALGELTAQDRLTTRWKSVIHLAFSNYQPWDFGEIKQFLEVYNFLVADKDRENRAAIWRGVALNRFGKDSQQELKRALRSEFKSVADYEWIPQLENIMRIRSGMMGAF